MDLQHAVVIRKAAASLASRNYFDARRLCHSVLSRQRNDPDALGVLARVAWAEGEYDEAIELLRTVVTKRPSDVPTRLLLGTYLNFKLIQVINND